MRHPRQISKRNRRDLLLRADHDRSQQGKNDGPDPIRPGGRPTAASRAYTDFGRHDRIHPKIDMVSLSEVPLKTEQPHQQPPSHLRKIAHLQHLQDESELHAEPIMHAHVHLPGMLAEARGALRVMQEASQGRALNVRLLTC